MIVDLSNTIRDFWVSRGKKRKMLIYKAGKYIDDLDTIFFDDVAEHPKLDVLSKNNSERKK